MLNRLLRRRRPAPAPPPDRVRDIAALFLHNARCAGITEGCTGPVFDDYAAADKMLGVFAREGYPIGGPPASGTVPARELCRGTVVRNPVWTGDDRQPSVLYVTAVEPADDGRVFIFNPEGRVRVAEDWPCEIYTVEAAAMEYALVAGEWDRPAGDG